MVQEGGYKTRSLGGNVRSFFDGLAADTAFASWWTAMPGIRPLLKLSYAANHASGFGVAGFKSPHNARAFNNVGCAYALACRPDDAAAAWETARERDPACFQAGVNLRLLRENALPGLAEACPGPGDPARTAPGPAE